MTIQGYDGRAALLFGSVGLAAAQGGASGAGGAGGGNTDATVSKGETGASKAAGQNASGAAQTAPRPTMQERPPGMSNTPTSAGPNETGTTKDSAGGGANRQQK